MSNTQDLLPAGFDALKYIQRFQTGRNQSSNAMGFQVAIERWKESLKDIEEELGDNFAPRQHDAITRDPSAMSFFKERIQNFIRQNPEMHGVHYPNHYENLTEALFEETLGFGPLSVWFKKPTAGAKVSGRSIMFDIDGIYQEQPFSFRSLYDVERVIRYLTLIDPTKQPNRHNPDVEVDLRDGTRVAILSTGWVKQPIFTLRQYTFQTFTFAHEAEMRTIGHEAVDLFGYLSSCYLNTAVSGPVKSGKTSFVTVIVGARNAKDIVASLETDTSEIRLHKAFPERINHIHELTVPLDRAPSVFRALLRHDARYIVLPEGRTVEIELILMAAKRGNGFVTSFHQDRYFEDMPAEFATEILRAFPSRNYREEYKRAAKALDVVINISPGKGGRKIVTAVYVYEFNTLTNELAMHPWIRYDRDTDSWTYNSFIPEGLREHIEGLPDPDLTSAFDNFERELKKLTEAKPMLRTAPKVVPIGEVV
ncbi:ATPase, T2SS/T4P/T4SS family [Alicyclobacillus mengziensis]|uniref:Flp pilus assembly complex ATPase component TadA n=1 Tax=Alicyclobacillus mengziensis TaxID=2931921 RepID=A0A9X7W4X3_9BACL|nr:ATPase, T2SS/T4P/T4SS family [Alicyclobacillus mengziensis]QSO50138.1 Flp pilus assembly complex ATPase component TadA [Alicyclobacillus mengziensis]